MRLLLLFFLAFSTVSCGKVHEAGQNGAADSSATDSSAVHKRAPLRLLAVNVQTTPASAVIGPDRVDAALAAIGRLLPQYEVVSRSARDSVVALFKAEGREATALVLAQEFGAERLVFTRVDRLENILRISLVLRSGPDFAQTQEGVGWALIRYRSGTSNEPIYDPAVLKATQRAFAAALNAPELFRDMQTPFNVRPAQPLVVGGLTFHDADVKPRWQLFESKIILSRKGVLSIIESAMESPDYVVYDIDSRDTAMARNNLYFVEDYRAPSSVELQTLEAFEVHRLIHGKISREGGGARIQLNLCTIANGHCATERTAEALLEEDSISDFTTILQQLTRELLSGGSGNKDGGAVH